MFGNTFKILCSLPWIQGPAPEDGKPPLPTKSFSTPTRTRAFIGPCAFIGIIQLLSHVWLFVITCSATKQASLAFTVSCSFLKLMSFDKVMPSHNLILLFPFFLPTFFPSIRFSSNELGLHVRWPVLELHLQHQSFHWILLYCFQNKTHVSIHLTILSTDTV